MKPSRRLTPIALTPLLVFAGSKYQHRSPIPSGQLKGQHSHQPSFSNVRGLLRDRNFNLHQGTVYSEPSLELSMTCAEVAKGRINEKSVVFCWVGCDSCESSLGSEQGTTARRELWDGDEGNSERSREYSSKRS